MKGTKRMMTDLNHSTICEESKKCGKEINIEMKMQHMERKTNFQRKSHSWKL